MLEQAEGDDGIVTNTMRNLRLVNRHWSSWAKSAIQMLTPSNVPLCTLLIMVIEKFVNLRSLKLERMEKICDEDLVSLGKLSTLTFLSFDRRTYPFVRKFGDVGVRSLVNLNALKELF